MQFLTLFKVFEFFFWVFSFQFKDPKQSKMAPFGGEDANRDPYFRNNPADWPEEDRLRYEDLKRREEGILLLKLFMVEKISKNTNCLIKIWKIIAVGKNMEFHRFRIFEYLNYRIFEFSDYRY